VSDYTPKQIANFWSKVDKSGGFFECWNWTGAHFSKGYGCVSLHGKQRLAHRVAWTITNGSITDGLYVCHHCDNPNCCNPLHLFLGTAKDNRIDCIQKGRANIAFGERHPSAKLTREQAQQIRQRYANGESQMALGREFGVSGTTIHYLVKGKTWK